jgi:hypothetical protein
MAGTITQELNVIPKSNMVVLTFTCTADAAAATFPTTSTNDDITDIIQGMYITEVRTNPGSTAPTDNYDIVINDADGIDLMGGSLLNRDASNSEAAAPAIATGVYWPRPVDGALTISISNNSVNSAVVVVKVFLSR